MFKVCETQCDQCLFSKNKIVSKERMKEVLESCKKDDTFFICHKSSITSKHGDRVCCKGFYDHGSYPTVQQLADRLGLTEFVPIPGEKE